MTFHDIRDQMANYNIYKDWSRKDSIERLVIHHSGPGSVWGNGEPNMSLKDMAKQHVENEGRAHVSYHYAINRDGKVFYLLDEKIPGYHAALPEPSDGTAYNRWLNQWQAGQYFNRCSVGILVLGWFDLNRQQNGEMLKNDETSAPSKEQWEALAELVKTIRQRYNISVSHVQGHGEVLREAGFGNTTCPGSQFDMARLRAALGQAVPAQPAAPQTAPSAPSLIQADKQLVVPGVAPSLKFPPSNPRWYYTSTALMPESLSPGIELNFPVAVGNGGQFGWLTEGPERTSVAVIWLDANNREVGQASWSRLPYNLSPGQRADFRMKITTPTVPGHYKLRLSAYHSGYKKWLDELDRSTGPDYFPTTISSTRSLEEQVYEVSSKSTEVEVPKATLVAVVYQATFPTEMTIGMQRELTLELHNQGVETWLAQGERPMTVVHQWLNEEGYLVQPTLRTMLPHDVAPNESLTVTIPILSPPKAGTYQLQIDMAQEGHYFFSQRGNAPLSAQIRVNEATFAPLWAAQWQNVELPAQLMLGQEPRIETQLRNIGQNIWFAHKIRLGYHWDDGPPHRVTLPTTVPPGGEIALGLPLLLPSERGTYTLTLDLWEEGNGWLEVGQQFKQLIILPAEEHILDADDLAISSPLETILASPSPVERQRLIAEPTDQPSSKDSQASPEEIVTLRNRTITANASHNIERAKYALDIHKITAWSSGEPQQAGMWFELDLGQSHLVHRIRLMSQPEKYPRGYILEGSQDGEIWEEVHRASENWADINQPLSSPKAMRYIRITQTRQNPWGEEWSIRDVQIDVERND